MANLKLIEAKTLGSNTASVTFTSIPQTYTDLKLVMSVRDTITGTGNAWQAFDIYFNGSNTGISGKHLFGTGSSAASNSVAYGYANEGSTTSNTFSNNEIYIPNYTSANYKSYSADQVTENNATAALSSLIAGLWSSTSAITSITCSALGTAFAANSTFYLYGISNVTTGSKATGGIVSYDSTYYYHTFPYSGTFTPTQSLTADILVIAGGGGGGGTTTASGAYGPGGGGGAGGLRSSVTATGGGGSLESALSLTAQAYAVTVGAGGAGGILNSGANAAPSGDGGNSTFSTITSTGGGGGGAGAASNREGRAGGSGGGGGGNNVNSPGQWDGGARTSSPVQGNAGGWGSGANYYSWQGNRGGGGGGAGSAGTDAGVAETAGKGGDGVQITAFAYPTQTGVNGFYAGGGSGGSTAGTSQVGSGGGGYGGSGGFGNATNGTPNTGAGGGGAQDDGAGGNGGSGLVIIRYAI